MVLASGSTPAHARNNRGHLFEHFVARLLRHFGYRDPLVENLNVTDRGIEIDIELRHQESEQVAIAECKAYSSTVEAKELLAFYGKLLAHRLEHGAKTEGFFVACPRLTRSGAEKARQIQSRDENFWYFDAERIVAVSAQQGHFRPDPPQPQPFFLRQPALLIAEQGIYASRLAVNVDTGEAEKVLVWGVEAVPQPVIDLLSDVEYSRGLCIEALPPGVAERTSPLPGDTLVQVTSTSDLGFRAPAAPEDLIGRGSLVDSIAEAVGPTNGVVTIQSKSGWGKSSLALAVQARLQSQGSTAVVLDVRTASHRTYVAAALHHCAQAAARQGVLDLREEGSWKSLNQALEGLREANWQPGKALLVFFDQFESVFSNEILLREFRNLALWANSQSLPVTIGFAWKTDTTPLIGRGYVPIRDQISAASTNFTLDPLSPEEIEQLVGGSEETSGKHLSDDLRRRIAQESQGLPWLARKFTDHLLSLSPEEALRANQSWAVGDLFEKDLRSLDPVTMLALTKLAQICPTATDSALAQVPSDVIASLIDARLVVQVGSHLDLYWDTFRDYIVSGRLPDEASSDGLSYSRTEWMTNGWSRFLPPAALFLEFAVCTAQVTNIDGSLDEIFETLGMLGDRKLEHGGNTILEWDTEDVDEETLELRTQARTAYESAIVAAGFDVPTTVEELATILATVGVYHHDLIDDVERWRCDEDLPEVAQIFSLDRSYEEREKSIRWLSHTSRYSFRLIDHMKEVRSAEYSVSVDRLATDLSMPVDKVRLGLEGLLMEAGISIERFRKKLGVSEVQALPLHARFTILADWNEIDADRWPGSDDDDDDDASSSDIDLDNIRWVRTPWDTYIGVYSDAALADAHKVVAGIPFRTERPDGKKGWETLVQIAASQGVSRLNAAKSLQQLERSGLVEWDAHEQVAVLKLPSEPD